MILRWLKVASRKADVRYEPLLQPTVHPELFLVCGSQEADEGMDVRHGCQCLDDTPMMAPMFEHKPSELHSLLGVGCSWVEKLIGASGLFLRGTPRRIAGREMTPMVVPCRQILAYRVHRMLASITSELGAVPLTPSVIEFRAIFLLVLLNRVRAAQYKMVRSFHGRPPVGGFVRVGTTILPNRNGLPPISNAVAPR